MPSNNYDIEPIERFLLGQMEPGELAAFEARLLSDEGQRLEVSAYRQLFDGFAAVRSEVFRGQMQAWEAEGDAAADEAELIEWFWNGELQGPGRAAFEERLREDARLARETEAYGQLHKGFAGARSEDFRGKLESWEKAQSRQPELRVSARRPALYRIAAAAAAVLLLAAFGLNWYARHYYSAGSLAGAYYQPPRSETVMGEGQPGLTEIARQFAQANGLFQQGQYPAAYQAFDALLAILPTAALDNFNRRYYQEQSEWNRLLAALAMDDPPISPAEEARRIAGAQGHEFQAAARELSGKMNSAWYKWAN